MQFKFEDKPLGGWSSEEIERWFTNQTNFHSLKDKFKLYSGEGLAALTKEQVGQIIGDHLLRAHVYDSLQLLKKRGKIF